MRILWIPHTRWQAKTAHRSLYLTERLARKHQVHVLTWTEPETATLQAFLNPFVHVKAFVPWTRNYEEVTLHHLSRITLHRVRPFWEINQTLFHKKIRQIVAEQNIDAIICEPNSYLFGFPPIGLDVFTVFDYVDYCLPAELRRYLEAADAVVCASRALQSQAQSLGQEALHIPNGVDMTRLLGANGDRVRHRLHLEGRIVVSLIGLTCAPDLYFSRSLVRLCHELPDVILLFVGGGTIVHRLARALRQVRSRCRWVGWVPRNEVFDYFMATDIGIYPGDNSPYFRSACPIKILEYAAVGKLVVSSPVDEVRVLDLTNVQEVEPSTDGFFEGLLDATVAKEPPRKVAVPSWDSAAERFDSVLRACSEG